MTEIANSFTNSLTDSPVESLTDFDRFKGLLHSFGIPFSVGINEYDESIVVIEKEYGVVSIVEGYSGFTCEWSFDENGKFVKVGIWE